MDIKSTSQSAVVRPEDENLGIGANIAYGFQHVLTMYGGIIAVPLIVGQAAGLLPAEIGLLIAASLFIGGIATLLHTLGVPFFGCQLPLVQGVSFASVATVVAIVTTGGRTTFCVRCCHCRLCAGLFDYAYFLPDYQVLSAIGHRHRHYYHWFDLDASCCSLGNGRQQQLTYLW